MRNLKKIGYMVLVSTLFLGACSKSLDINIDPYDPSEQDASPHLLFPSGVAYSAAKIGGDLQLLGGLWSQHYTQNNNSSQYRDIDSYSLTNQSYNGIWFNLFGGGMKDLQLARTKAEGMGQWHYFVASSIMLAFDYHVLVDLYGDLPIKEGLQGDLGQFTPKWDDGKTANGLILEQLDAALAKIEQARQAPSMGTNDFVFAGNMDHWRKFAKSLKLKILMRDFDANRAAITTLLNEADLLNTDAKMTAFEDQVSKSNPLYESERRTLGGPNIRASRTLLYYLQQKGDPRISDFFELASNGNYEAYRQGDYFASSTVISSRASLAATDPVYFMSYAEVEFLQAEAFARTGEPAKAAAHYNAGVTASFARWGKNAAPFLAENGKYAFRPGAVESMLEQIILQKWVAATRCQAWDSFYDQNRTGYPRVSTVEPDSPNYVAGHYTVSVNSALPGNELPRRLAYPKNSSDFNPNTPKVVPINTKMWWHKK